MTPTPLLAPRRSAAGDWHPVRNEAEIAPFARLRLLQAAFPPCWIGRTTAQTLLDAAQVFHFEPGALGISPRQHAPAWWLVADGRLVAGKPGARGGLVESRLVEAGHWLDVVSGWTGSDWIEDAVCSTEGTLWALPLDTLLACARQDASLQQGMGCVMAGQVRQLSDDRHALATKDVTARLASWLLRQLPAAAEDSVAITLREQKRAIARQLVMAQETLSRCFRRLVDLGCIEMKGYQVTVRDLRALQLLAASPVA